MMVPGKQHLPRPKHCCLVLGNVYTTHSLPITTNETMVKDTVVYRVGLAIGYNLPLVLLVELVDIKVDIFIPLWLLYL